MSHLNSLRAKLRASKEASGPLLDHTQVHYGSNLSNGNNHDNRNLPIS